MCQLKPMRGFPVRRPPSLARHVTSDSDCGTVRAQVRHRIKRPRGGLARERRRGRRGVEGVEERHDVEGAEHAAAEPEEARGAEARRARDRALVGGLAEVREQARARHDDA